MTSIFVFSINLERRGDTIRKPKSCSGEAMKTFLNQLVIDFFHVHRAQNNLVGAVDLASPKNNAGLYVSAIAIHGESTAGLTTELRLHIARRVSPSPTFFSLTSVHIWRIVPSDGVFSVGLGLSMSNTSSRRCGRLGQMSHRS